VTFLLDTNSVLRLGAPEFPEHADITKVFTNLLTSGWIPVISPQVIYEPWTVLTRPIAQNGWGLTPQDAAYFSDRAIDLYGLQIDPPNLVQHWLTLCKTHEVRGKQAHDCRLVAWMELNGIRHLLTLNSADFARYPQVEVLSLGL